MGPAIINAYNSPQQNRIGRLPHSNALVSMAILTFIIMVTVDE